MPQSLIENEQCDCPDPGIPSYMGTFADLMALLLCFFVLLLSFSEIEALKFKMVIKSMQDAFGVEREISPDIPVLGTSIIKQDFSPSLESIPPNVEVKQISEKDKKAIKTSDIEAYKELLKEEQRKILNQLLAVEIGQNALSLETVNDRVTIRINERSSFDSGKAKIKSTFLPVLFKIRRALAQTNSEFIVSGHTDDIPVSIYRFRSNWELAAARATSVVHVLLADGAIAPNRFRIEGHADTKPLTVNNSIANRAINRRVEISLLN